MRCIFLDSIVGQVDLSLEVLDIKLVRSRSNVPFLKPISFHHSIYLADHHVMPNVELTFFVKKRAVYVELDNESLFASVVMGFLGFYDRIQLINFINNRNTIPSVS